MKLKILLTLLSTATLSLTCQGPENDDIHLTVLKGATFFDGTGAKLENATVIIADARIQEIGDDHLRFPTGSKIIDLQGKFITPGLVDAHVHFFQTGFFDSRPDNADLRDSITYMEVQAYQKTHPERYYEAYLRSGITAVYDVGGFPWSIDLQGAAEDNLSAPHVAAAGALLTPASEQRIATFNTPIDNTMIHLSTAEIGRKTVEQNSLLGSTGIKIWGMTPQDSAFIRKIEAIADEIEKRGNKMIVHATSLEQAKMALNFDAKLLVHSVQDREVDDEFIELIKAGNTIYTPTLIVSRGYYNTYKAIDGQGFMITDPNQVVDSKTRSLLEGAEDFNKYLDGEWLQNRIDRSELRLQRQDSIMALNLKKLFDAGVLIAVGTDAGNPGTLHGISIFDEMEAMQKAGIPANDLIVMATRNGAMAMDRLSDFGTVESGKMADLIILDKDPSQDIANMRSITHVMRGGLLRLVDENFEDSKY